MRVTKFELEVLVGGQPLTEYVLPATGDTRALSSDWTAVDFG